VDALLHDLEALRQRDGVVLACTMSRRRHSKIERHARLIDGDVVDLVTSYYDETQMNALPPQTVLRLFITRYK